MTTYYRMYPTYDGTFSVILAEWVEAKAVRKYKRETRKHLRKYLGVKGKISFITRGTATDEDFAGTCIFFTRKGLKIKEM